MPFACAAILGIALVYFTYLTFIQIFSGPKRDASSHKPVPPRALSGNGAIPVMGHTGIFWKLGTDMVMLFPPYWKEWRCIPWSDEIGTIFSVFVWGQWRVVINGPERCRIMLEEGELEQGWAWSAPTTLLGRNCLALLEQEEADCMRAMISGPLSQASVIKHAPAFADAAERCLLEIIDGCFEDNKKKDSTKPRKPKVKKNKVEDIDKEQPTFQEAEEPEHDLKMRWEALRSYTMDIIDGPVLNMHQFERDAYRPHVVKNGSVSNDNAFVRFEDELIQTPRERRKLKRNMMLLWMERLKYGLCDIKMTFGASWLHLWRLNPYGRAIQARGHLLHHVGKHVEVRAALVSVRHKRGSATREPLAAPIPIIAITKELFGRRDTVMGRRWSKRSHERQRAYSETEITQAMSAEDNCMRTRLLDSPSGVHFPPPRRARSLTEPGFSPHNGSTSIFASTPTIPSDTQGQIAAKGKPLSVLDQILRQSDTEGQGISKAATTEVSLLLWMMLDAGQAWTAMAMDLLARETDAMDSVQIELNHLIRIFGKERLFTPFVLGKMVTLDALISEAIRLCPDFLGSLRVTRQTVEMEEVQIPKNTNVILCNPTPGEFDLIGASHKKPERMGFAYPTIELNGLLPFEGMEVPLMVLQTKVFLLTILQHYRPSLSTKQTFIRRVGNALGISKHDKTSISKIDDSVRGIGSTYSDEFDLEHGLDDGSMHVGDGFRRKSRLPARAMTTFPFPEPKRAVILKRIER